MKTCKNCAKKTWCPWVNCNYCIQWTDEDLGYQTINDLPLPSPRCQSKSQGLRKILKLYIDHCTRDELEILGLVVSNMDKLVDKVKENW